MVRRAHHNVSTYYLLGAARPLIVTTGRCEAPTLVTENAAAQQHFPFSYRVLRTL